MSVHTQGEWKVHSVRKQVVAEDGSVIASIHGSGDKAVANARLIAAAPKMLDEVRDRLAQHRCDCGHPACKACRADRDTEALLARVEGR